MDVRADRRREMSAPTETERLAAFRQYAFMTDEPMPALREICQLAVDLFAVSYAGVSLVGDEDIRVLTSDAGAPSRAPLAGSFSVQTILGDDILVLDGATLEVPDLPGRAPPNVRFCAGSPLAAAPGINIGALCIADAEPRAFGDHEKKQLRRLARLVMNELHRQRALLDLQRRDIMFDQASRLAKIGCIDWNPVSGVTSWTPEVHNLLDHPRDQPPLTAEGFLDRVAPKDRKRMMYRITRPDRGDVDEPDVEIIRPDGQSRWLKIITETAVKDGQAEHIFACLQDVTELHLSHAEIERLAFRDALTGLPNRALFNSQFEAAIDQARRNGTKVGLLMLDLDHFKDINDTLGHDAGDVLLRSVADLLTRSYRSTDTVARLGGDEFAVILPDINGPEDLERPTEVLMELLRHPVEHGGQIFTISASVGGALYPTDNADAGQLLKNADIALYQAKAAGRNRLTTFKPQMRAQVTARIETLREVRQGVSEGAFVLYYQPVINVAPAAVTGFEALMRWNHPTRGLLTPDAFMAGFEDPDLSKLLGEVTLEDALKQMRAWMEQGVEFGRVAINISGVQFRNPDLAETVEARLRHWGVPPERLTIEVTENVYMGWGSDVVGETVRRLHDAGVLIALDDFGTGYASLTNLKQFPIDRLKIDKSFVQNTGDQAIVQAVINLGTSLGMKVVAEGVEQQDQLDFLARSGCDQAQGFHFARPMPGPEVAGFLQTFGRELPKTRAGG